MLYIYNWDGSEPSISLQDVRSRWSGIADALHACANRGWQGSVDTEGPEQAAPYPVLSPAQPLFHAGRNMGGRWIGTRDQARLLGGGIGRHVDTCFRVQLLFAGGEGEAGPPCGDGRRRAFACSKELS